MKLPRNRHVWLGAILLTTLAIALVSGWFRWQYYNYRAMQAVTPGVLYRSGQLSEHGLRRMVQEYGIKTVINLRRGESPKERRDYDMEVKVCNEKGVQFVHLPLRDKDDHAPHTTTDQQRIVEEAAEQFLRVLKDPETYPRPVLIHCLAGMHRTGVMCAVYRMECEGWTKERAIEEMRSLGYIDFSSPDGLRDTAVNWKKR